PGTRAEESRHGDGAVGGGRGWREHAWTDPVEALGQESWGRPGPEEPWRHPVPPRPAGRKGAADGRRRARAAERRRAAADAKRSRAALRPGPARRESPQVRAADRHRSALLVMVLTLGLLIAAVAVTGGLIAASMRTRPVPLADPLHIYPVTQATPGQCAAGTRGITGQSASGATCYRLEQGLAIHEVAELHVQRSRVRQGGYDVALTLRPADRNAFADLTRSTVGRDLAFVVRDEIVTLPRVDMEITDGNIIVTGAQDRASAVRLVRDLRGR
ncbi:SecDF P1 head subdomain-containing protein, partial [Actinomadura sp. WAC 06369]|uniref:SecDF P1 head subdomain-containing protein n=1 Tax=Actinomadura sp. WAC 06369 TaxID=2203193 RepID=UPI002D792756